MAMLVILLPARPRAPAASAAPPAADALGWLLSSDGLTITRQGRSGAGQLPPADSVVVVVPATELAWHRPVCPKAPANRLRAALGGLMEEQLLADDEQVHLALAPGHSPGQPTWLAALDKPWLKAQLDRLQAADLVVDRVVPAWAPALGPAAEPALHVFTQEDATEPGQAWIALSDADQALCLPLAGSLAHGLQARWLAKGAKPTATAAAAALAERALQPAEGQPAPTVALRSEAEAALAAVRSPWQLLQFDLAPRHRGTRALGNLWHQAMSPAWRPARIGVAALLLVQVLGLNLYAWQQQRALSEQRAAMEALLRSSFPQLRTVLDVPVQMQRETDALREAAGVPGDNDFETLLGAAAMAWPDGQPPATQLRFEPGRLSLVATGWAEPQQAQFRSRLMAGGWWLEQADGRLNIQRADQRRATP